MGVRVEVTDWKNDKTVKLVELTSEAGFKVRLLSLGATVQSVVYPGPGEETDRDVVLGFDDASGYDGTQNPFFWGTTGRFTNRIKNGTFSIDGVSHQLSLNDFGNGLRNHLHGGKVSYDRQNWRTSLLESGDGVVFSIMDPHGSEGYPGNLVCSVTYKLRGVGKCDLGIEVMAVSDQATIINVSNHVYFNLAGHGSGWQGLSRQKLQINAESFTPDDEEYLPTGEISSVSGTENDFTSAKLFSECVSQARNGVGYCVNFCVGHQDGDICKVASLDDGESGRRLEVWTDQPGLELYTANFLPLPGESGLKGKDGQQYQRWGGVCLMTQNYRDSVNHNNFPSGTLRPGEVYRHRVNYKFF